MNLRKVLIEALPLLLNGAIITLKISVLSMFFGTVLGLSACTLRIRGNLIGKTLSLIYVWSIRSTPMIVQAFIIYFGFPQFIQVFFYNSFSVSITVASIITLSLNSGAYLSEIFRAGINGVSKGQIEASRSLGISAKTTMNKIVIPQAVRIVLPSLVNQFIILIKDTSILSVIGLSDIVNKARTYVGATYQFFSTYIIVAILYCIIISILMFVSHCIEKRYQVYDD